MLQQLLRFYLQQHRKIMPIEKLKVVVQAAAAVAIVVVVIVVVVVVKYNQYCNVFSQHFLAVRHLCSL